MHPVTNDPAYRLVINDTFSFWTIFQQIHFLHLVLGGYTCCSSSPTSAGLGYPETLGEFILYVEPENNMLLLNLHRGKMDLDLFANRVARSLIKLLLFNINVKLKNK